MKPSRKLMALIDHHGALSASEASEMMNMSRSQIGRHAHNLVGRGWARSVRDPDDKRIVLFDLTRAGKSALDNDDMRRVMVEEC